VSISLVQKKKRKQLIASASVDRRRAQTEMKEMN
jgi:hypothetical protein